MNSKKGFTLVELLGVLVVLGLISVIIVPKVIDSITTSKESAYQTQVETIENAAKKYGISNDLLYPKEGEKKYIAVKDLIAVGELSDKEIINPKTGNKMNGYVLVEYNSGYQQYEYTYVEEIDENALGAMGPIYEVKDPDKWTTSKNVTIIYPKGNGKYEYDFIFKGIVEIGGQEYNYTEQDWKDAKKWIGTTELRKNITFKTKGSLIARVKNKDEYIYGSTLEILKIDNTAPSAKLGYDDNTLTTNKIDLVATCTDDESGISKYLFKLGNGNWIDNGTSNKYTFSNLNNTTSYNFSVECINGVGMISQDTNSIKLNDIDKDKDKDNIRFEVSDPSIWKTNKNVKIFYPGNYTRYEFSIIDGTATRNGQELTPGTWYIASSLQETVNFTTEGTIAARIYDGTNLSSIANQAITYVDPTKPTCEILLTGGTLGTNGYYTVVPKVQLKTSIAGGSGISFGQSTEYGNSVTKNNSGLINITSFSEGNNAYYGFVKTGAGNTSTCTASFKADTFKPVVAINGNASVSYANSSTTITIPLKVTDLTSGIDTNTFTADDITVKVGTTTVTPTKSLKYNSVSNGVYSYTLTLSGVTGTGALLKLSVGAGMVVDKAGNQNDTASISTNVIIDNIAPTLEITGTNGTTYKKESDATITLKDRGGSGLTAGSYTIKYGWATSSQACSNLTSSTTITVAAGATSGSVKVNIKDKTGAGKIYVCNSTSITDRAKNTLSANSIVSSNMYLDNEAPQIVINPNGGSYTIPVGSTSTAVRKTITVTDSTLNKSSLKYGWSSSKDVKPTMSSSFTSGTSFNDSLSGGDNYLWITASDNLSNTTTIVSNSFNVGYSVEYNANGGTTTCSVQRKEHGKNLTLCSTTPIRSGYTFAGWSDSSTATSKKYDASGTYTDNSPVKLYAVWKKTTTVTAATKSKVYDGKALTSNECSASNLASGHTVTCTNNGTITDVGSVANSVNTVKITDSNGNDVTDTYSVTKVNGKLTVTKANSTNPTLTAYEGIYDATSHTFTISGGVGGTINYSINNGTTWTTTKPTRTTAGTTTVQVKIVGDKNHNDTSVISTTIKIDKRAITVKAAVAEKTYDGTVLTKTDGCESTTNLVSGHEAKCTNTGALLNAGSSENTLSAVSVVSATGADVTGNYEITKVGGRLTVKPKSIAVTWESTTTFTYNGDAQGPSLSSTSLTGANSETVYIAVTNNEAKATSVGSYTAKATCVHVSKGQESKSCDNYTLTGNTKSFTINKATPTITLSAVSGSVVKGKTLTFTEKANVVGKFTNTSGTTSVATVSPTSSSTAITANTTQTVTVTGVTNGSSTITVNFVPTDTTNYNNAVAKTYTATILNSATIPTNSLCVARTYNGSDQQITSATSGTGYTLSGYKQKTAGSHTITAKLASGYRWSDNTTGAKTFSCSINKATPTITLSAASGSVVKGKTLTFTEKANVVGKFTNTSGTTSVATVSPTSSSTAITANTTQTVTVTGVTNGSSTITVNFVPTDTTNYNNAVAKTYTATILNSATIPTNSLCVARTYNGSDQQITSATSGTGYTLSGYKQKTAGSHTITAKLASGYRWSDNTTGTKTFSCSISKATPTVTIDSSTWFNSPAYPVSQKASVAGTFNDAVSDGSTSIVQIVSNSSISVSANVSAKMLLKSNGTGTKNITIKFIPTDTTNYNSVTKTFTAKSDKTGPTIPFERFTEGEGTNWCNKDNWLLGWLPEDKNSGVSSTIPDLSSPSSQITFSVGGVTKSASFGYDCPNVAACKAFYNQYFNKSNNLSSYSNFYYMMYKPTTAGVGTGATVIVIPAGLFKDNVGNSNVKTTLYGATLTSSAC